MWALLGLLIGALIGHALWRQWGAVIGGLAGFFIGATMTGRRGRDAYRKPDAVASAAARPAGQSADAVLIQRVTALEQRIDVLERALGPAVGVVPLPERAADIADTTSAGEPSIAPEPLPPAAAQASADVEPAPSPDAITPSAPETPVAASPTSPFQPLWAWFTGGNALTRIGVVVLFFGVAFLLRYFAEHFTLTIELKLSMVATAGAALIGLGLWLASSRAAYALSLQGAGAGILYLTTYAAFRVYAVLPDEVAIALLIAVATLTVFLASRANSQPLAGLAIAGGFLAPMLAEKQGEPVLLFGYFAILNAAIFALAWRRAWRALNVLGFACTFALGLFWGHAYYAPAYFATVEPFLALFVAFYIAIAILEARRGVQPTSTPIDGLLVFGVPLVGFGLQVALVRDFRYGAAWSALALALIYGVLFTALRARREPSLALLAKAFLALAVIFATLAIPFALDDQWTAALWAIEAAGVYWMGVAQRSSPARGFALLVELAAGAAFIWAGAPWNANPLFVNAHFIGAMLIALSGLFTAFIADRTREALSAPERQLTVLIFGWGALWWLGAGATEIIGHLAPADEPHAVLAWVTASVALAVALRSALSWPRLIAAGLVLLPVMGWVALRDFDVARTSMTSYGWLVFPLAWITHWFVLRAADMQSATPSRADTAPRGTAGALRVVHTGSVLALTAQAAWEASEWVGRWTPTHTAWAACATAVPAIACLWLVSRWRANPRWPFTLHGDAYAVGAGAPIAALLAVWFFAANALSPGDASPLPYLPLINPLEVTLALVLVVVVGWSRRFARMSERMLYGWVGAAVFVALNGVVLRVAHHWGDIEWRLSALLASKPLQAALTLSWTVAALAAMFVATSRRLRPLWMVGAGLLAAVVGKLFLIDLGGLSGLPRVVAFLGVGMLLLLIGYLSPLPPTNEKG